MSPERRKIVLGLFTTACVVGALVLVYIGYVIFHDRPTVFWVFCVYDFLLTGVVIFFGFRLIGAPLD